MSDIDEEIDDSDDEEPSLMNKGASLTCLLQQTAADTLRSATSLTVLAEQNDPYRQYTPSNLRDASWFQKMVERFLGPQRKIHLRGLPYLITSAGDVSLPNGDRCVNTDEFWIWMSAKAAKAARWLGYVPFERIIDERNEPPILPDGEVEETAHQGWKSWSSGLPVQLPYETSILPSYYVSNKCQAQPYRIIFFGEKTSLKEMLLPFVSRVNGELVLPTGEASDTLIAGVARRAAEDQRRHKEASEAAGFPQKWLTTWLTTF
jgi:hypothetical protein